MPIGDELERIFFSLCFLKSILTNSSASNNRVNFLSQIPGLDYETRGSSIATVEL